MAPALSVLVDHVELGITELRSRLTAVEPLSPYERIAAVREVAAAAAGMGQLCLDLARRPTHARAFVVCASWRRRAGSQRAALAGDLTAADRLTPAVFAALTTSIARMNNPDKRRAHRR